MKKRIIVIVFVALILSGCDIFADLSMLPVFETPEAAAAWVYDENNIQSLLNKPWQPPQTTLDLRTGDCDDKSILTVYIIHEQFGIDCSVQVLRNMETGRFHMRPLLDGVSLEPYDFPNLMHVIYYDYETVMTLLPLMDGE